MRLRAHTPDSAAASLRFMCAVKLRQQGVPIEQVSRLLGHSDYETTMRYLGAIASDASQAASALKEIEQAVIPHIDTSVYRIGEQLQGPDSLTAQSSHCNEAFPEGDVWVRRAAHERDREGPERFDEVANLL